MRRFCLLAAVLALVVGGQVAYGQGQVVGYYASGVTGGTDVLIVDPVPAGGLVITDILKEEASPAQITLKEEIDGGPAEVKMKLTMGISDTHQPNLHLNSGIPFTAGAKVYVSTLGNATVVTLMGYIPNGSATVPAIGELGMAVMAAAVLMLGAIVFTRMKQRQAA